MRLRRSKECYTVEEMLLENRFSFFIIGVGGGTCVLHQKGDILAYSTMPEFFTSKSW